MAAEAGKKIEEKHAKRNPEFAAALWNAKMEYHNWDARKEQKLRGFRQAEMALEKKKNQLVPGPLIAKISRMVL